MGNFLPSTPSSLSSSRNLSLKYQHRGLNRDKALQTADPRGLKQRQQLRAPTLLCPRTSEEVLALRFFGELRSIEIYFRMPQLNGIIHPSLPNWRSARSFRGGYFSATCPPTSPPLPPPGTTYELVHVSRTKNFHASTSARLAQSIPNSRRVCPPNGA